MARENIYVTQTYKTLQTGDGAILWDPDADNGHARADGTYWVSSLPLSGSGDDWGVRFCGNDHLLTGVLLAVFQGGYCLVGVAGVHMQGRQASASAINFRNSVEGGAAVGGQFGYIKNGASAGRGVCTEIEGNGQSSIVYINFP